MSNVFFIADTHFQHGNILSYEKEKRPFSSIQEHDNALIDNWNSVVNKKDKVFHLGDFAFKDISIAEKLNGNKTLILGNHDFFKPCEYAKYFHSIHGILRYKEFMLSHAPLYDDKYTLRDLINVHGHLHSNKINSKKHINISCDMTDLKPISYNDLKLLIQN